MMCGLSDHVHGEITQDYAYMRINFGHDNI